MLIALADENAGSEATVRERIDTVLLAQRYLTEHPKNLSSRTTGNSRGTLPESASVRQIAEFLGEENWSKDTVSDALLLSKLDPKVLDKIAPIGTTHPSRKQMLSVKAALALTEIENVSDVLEVYMENENKNRKVPPEGTPERREYNRLKTKASRDRKREIERWDYELPKTHEDQLRRNREPLLAQIKSELGLIGRDEEIITTISDVLFGIENFAPQPVTKPDGLLIADWFPDAVTSTAIEHVHGDGKHLLESRAFVSLYRRFIPAAVNLFKTRQDYWTPEFVEQAKQELERLIPLPEPITTGAL